VSRGNLNKIGNKIFVLLCLFTFVFPALAADAGQEEALPQTPRILSSEAWVDFSYAGTETGSFAEPFNTITEAIQAVAVDGTVWVRAGSTNETFGTNKPFRLKNYEDTVTIGRGAGRGFPQFKGKTNCAWGSRDCNPCVNNVINSFNRIREYGDILGFHLGGHPDPTKTDHWQGIQRTMIDGGRYLIVTRKDINGYSGFAVVDMASRDRNGKRYRSNRLGWHADFNDTAPPIGDTIIHTESLSSSLNHAGGIQLLGNILAVPLENSDGTKSEIHFFDMSVPSQPRQVGQTLRRWNISAGTATLGQMPDGHYLLIVGGPDANPLDFYISALPNTLEFQHFYQWDKRQILNGEFEAYQSINLVTECGSGDLYLAGTHGNTYFEDWADLFSLRNGPGESVEIREVSNKHVYCGDYQGTDHCNFDAAAGIYVDPSNQLYLYSAEHDNDGPGGSIKFMEFRPVPHGSCNSINEAWVELYQDDTFRNRGLMIDYRDSGLEDYSNYNNVEGFGDKASAVRWCIPPGYSYTLYEDDTFRGAPFPLIGTGRFEEIPNLHDRGFGDKASSSRW